MFAFICGRSHFREVGGRGRMSHPLGAVPELAGPCTPCVPRSALLSQTSYFPYCKSTGYSASGCSLAKLGWMSHLEDSRQKRKVTEWSWSCRAKSCLSDVSFGFLYAEKLSPFPFCWELLSHFLLHSSVMFWGSKYNNRAWLWLEGLQFGGQSENTEIMVRQESLCSRPRHFISCLFKLAS